MEREFLLHLHKIRDMRPIIHISNMIIVVACVLLLASCHGGETDSRLAAEESGRGDSLLQSGDYRNAMNAYVEAFRLSEISGNDSVKVKALGKIGTIYALHDDFQKAVSYYERAVATAFSSGDSASAAPMLANLIMMEKTLGDREKERRYTELYFRHPSRDRDNRDYYALYIPFLSHMEAGRDSEMQDCFRRLMQLIASRGMKRESSAVLYNHLGMRYMQRDMTDSALYCYQTALRRLGAEDDPSARQAVYTNMCRLFKETGNTDSLAYYQALMIEASDSIFNIRSFNAAKDALDTYETSMTQRHISRLETIAEYAAAAVLLVAVVMTVIIVYTRKVNRARLALVRRTETLMKENESLGRKIALMEKAVAALQGSHTEESDTVVAPCHADPDAGDPAADDPEGEEEETPRRPLMSDELRAKLSAQIIEIMNDKVTVFNPDYNQGMLAVQLGTNTRYVTEVIRGLGASNFRNFINEYRIREACRRLADKEHYGHLTISAIASEVGFNSDSRFMVAFKKVMEMTPAQYRRLSRVAQE